MLMTGCRSTAHSSRLEVPISSWPGYEYFYVAAKHDLGRAGGLTIDPVQFSDPQEIVHAYLRGDLAIAQLTTVEVIDICAKAPDRCPVLVLVLDESRGGDQLMVRPGVSDVAALRGKQVGVTLSTLGPYLLSRALQRSGMRLEDVRIRNVTLDAMPDALAQGKVDAVAIFPPFSSVAQHKAGARTVFDSRQIPGEIFDVLVVEPDFLERNRPALVELIRAWQAAHRLAADQPVQVRELMARRQQISLDDLKDAEAGIVYFSLDQQRSMLRPEGLIARNLRAVQQVQVELNLAPLGAPLPEVTPDLVTEALP